VLNLLASGHAGNVDGPDMTHAYSLTKQPTMVAPVNAEPAGHRTERTATTRIWRLLIEDGAATLDTDPVGMVTAEDRT
jgi:hypothetical protein